MGCSRAILWSGVLTSKLRNFGAFCFLKVIRITNIPSSPPLPNPVVVEKQGVNQSSKFAEKIGR
jgi:hypothetical protein